MFWWNIVKGRLVWPEYTWGKFLGGPKGKILPVVVQRKKEREILELKMSVVCLYCSTLVSLENYLGSSLNFYPHSD